MIFIAIYEVLAQCFPTLLFCHFEKISRHPHQQWRTLPSPMTPISPLGQSSMLSENLIVPWLISLWVGHSLCPRNLYCPSCCCHHSCHIASIDITISLTMGLRTDKRAPTSSTIVTSVRFHPCTPPIIWKDMLGKSMVSPGSWLRLFETTFKEPPLYQPTLWKSGWEGSHCARPLCLFPKCILNVNCILNHQHALI